MTPVSLALIQSLQPCKKLFTVVRVVNPVLVLRFVFAAQLVAPGFKQLADLWAEWP